MKVTVETSEGDLSFEAPTMAVAVLVAQAHGFGCEIEPMEPGRVNLTAKRGTTTLNFRGTTENDAAANLIKGLTNAK